MYSFYADESGMSQKKSDYDKEQPILVVAGILIDVNKITKVIQVVDAVLKDIINDNLRNPVPEMKFSQIRNKKPYTGAFPDEKDRISLFTRIIKKFQKELEFKVFYCAIDNKVFFTLKEKNTLLKNYLKHPYLCASYKVISELEHLKTKTNHNYHNTFLFFDQQSKFQKDLAELITHPLHLNHGFQILIDTIYFGDSKHAKIIQIADLMAGMIRCYLMKRDKDKDWARGIQKLIPNLNIIKEDCFQTELELKDIYTKEEHFKVELKDIYTKIEITL